MRLIDVDALRADYGMAEDCKDCKTGWKTCQYDRDYSKMDFCGWLDDAPTVDAVEVVRCKDCKFFSHGYCRFHDAKFVRPDGYCYWGERKEGEQHG